MTDAERLAYLLAQGSRAKILGGKSLRGVHPTTFWIDGVEEKFEWRSREEGLGVWVNVPDGTSVLFATATYERARQLLAEAEDVARKMRAEA